MLLIIYQGVPTQVDGNWLVLPAKPMAFKLPAARVIIVGIVYP